MNIEIGEGNGIASVTKLNYGLSGDCQTLIKNRLPFRNHKMKYWKTYSSNKIPKQQQNVLLQLIY